MALQNFEIQVLVINYGKWNITLSCVKSLMDQKVNIVVLDNFFDPTLRKKEVITIQTIKNLGAEVVFFNKNYGYLGAALYYLNNISGKWFNWTIIMNNDITLYKGNVLGYLRHIEKNNLVWSVAPSIVETDGKELNPYFKNSLSRLKKILFKFYFLNFYLALLVLKLRKLILPKKIEKSQYEQTVFSMNGAVFILRAELICELIKVKPLSFLYGEETLITEIIQKHKKTTFFTNHLNFIHQHSITVGKKLDKQKFIWMKTAYKESIKRGYNFYKL